MTWQMAPPDEVLDAGWVDAGLVLGPIPVPDGEHPHACVRAGLAQGLGPYAGRTWWIDQPVLLRASDVLRPVVELGGFPVALAGRVRGRSVVVTATESLRWALQVGTGSAGAHPQVPEVDASGWSIEPPPGLDRDHPGLVRAAGHAARGMPAEVHDALVDLADDPGPAGALLLRGVDMGQVPATPAGPDEVGTDKVPVSEFALLAVARRLGQPVGYLAELNGRVVQDIVPTRSGSRAQVSTSSRVRLDWHTEAAFHPHRPRYLVLACLRGDPEAATLLCSVRHLVQVLGREDVSALREPRYRTAVDESYLSRRAGRSSRPGPVVRGPVGGERLWFDADLMTADTDRHARALAALRTAVDEHHTRVTLRHGDVLVVDNDLAVHGRSAFEPRWDGTDRWLQRTFVVADLGASATERRGRVIDTWFLGDEPVGPVP